MGVSGPNATSLEKRTKKRTTRVPMSTKQLHCTLDTKTLDCLWEPKKKTQMSTQKSAVSAAPFQEFEPLRGSTNPDEQQRAKFQRTGVTDQCHEHCEMP
mmetsp:Transcript_51044/g.136129  ORF Transcript_51044/g.136129 Transcript_51044/m.136129 type:complete len:99 (-) Transcript_51044:1105-1401(-)